MPRAFPLLLLLLASACRQEPPRIAVHDAWARATAPGQTQAAVYLTVENSGDEADRLVGASAAGFGMTMLHGSSEAGGIVRMEAVDGGLEVPGHGQLTLSPGGKHVMLSGGPSLAAGSRFPVTLRFARSGERAVEVAVLPADAAGPAGR